MSDHIADDEGHAGAGQLDDVEPVASHAVVHRRHIARGHFDSGAAAHTVREQVALEREGRGPLAGVLKGVLQEECDPGDEFLGEQQVVLLERLRLLGSAEECQSEHAAPPTDGHDHQ